MKKVLAFSLVALLLLTLTCCTDYPDEWGFDVSTDYIKSEVLNVTTSSYDAQITANIIVNTEGEGINGAGFIVKTSSGTEHIETIPINFTQDGNGLKISHTLSKLRYDEKYDIQLYVENEHVQFVMKGTSLSRSLRDFIPQISNCNISMTKDYEIHIHLDGRNTYNTATATFGNIQVDGRVNGEGLEKDIECDFIIPLSSLSLGTHKDGIQLTITNNLGSITESIPYQISISNATQDNTSDGEKSDCVTFAGIDWAKGNLVYDKGKWLISDHPLSPSLQPANNSYSEYFTWYSIENSSSFNLKIYSTERFGYDYYGNIQGDPQHDIVAAHLSGWQMPSTEDFKKLESCQKSFQMCSNGVLYYPVMNGREYYSATPVNLEERPTGGLYFSATIQDRQKNVIVRSCKWGSTHQYATSVGQYMASKGYMESHSSENSWSWYFLGYPDTYCFTVSGDNLNSWCNVKAGSSNDFACPTTWYKLPVRPVKRK